MKNNYPPNQYCLVDDYIINDGKTHPFAMVCPGGGYSFVSYQYEGIDIAKELNKKGISAFILYYRVEKKSHFPAPMDDLARGIKEIFDNIQKYPIDPSSYSIWGFSAGGHLAASFGTESMGYKKYNLPKPKTIILSYPVVTMDKKYAHEGSRTNLIGKEPTQDLINLTSIEKSVTENFPPTFIWCGDVDETVDPINSKMLADALKKLNVPVFYEVFPNVGHGVAVAKGTNAEGWIDKAVDFWMKYK